MINFLKKNLNYMDILLTFAWFFAGICFEKYGFIPGRVITKSFILITSSYLILGVSLVVKFILLKKDKDVESIKKERDTYKKIVIKTSYTVQEKIRNRIIETVKTLGFYEQKNKTDRITIYAMTNNSFFALERFSLNPKYANIDKSKIYPLDKGCIAQGYEHGFYVSENDIPDPQESFSQYDDYTRQKYKYTHSEVRSMSMRSTYYAVARICKNDKCLGVIVLESTKKQRFSNYNVKKILEILSTKVFNFLDILDLKAKDYEFVLDYKNES